MGPASFRSLEDGEKREPSELVSPDGAEPNDTPRASESFRSFARITILDASRCQCEKCCRSAAEGFGDQLALPLRGTVGARPRAASEGGDLADVWEPLD